MVVMIRLEDTSIKARYRVGVYRDYPYIRV